MVKIVKSFFCILVLFSTLLGANTQLDMLKEYDKKIIQANSDELLRIHHDLKSIYIKSIVKNDVLLKKEVLERLIKSSKALRLDSKNYEREFETLNKTVKKPVQKQKKVKENIKATQKAPTTLNEKIVNKYSDLLPKLKTFSNKGDFLLLEFDKRLSKKDVNRFALKSKNSYREVFDIKGVLPFEPKIKTPSVLRDMRIAQYNKKNLRLVLERSKAFKSKITVSKNMVRVYYGGKSSITTKKTVLIKPKKSLAFNKTIVIDGGHGGRDPGAVASKKLLEKHAVLKISLRIGSILKKRGYKVYYTRTKDKFIRLRDRTKYANKKNADLFLSIHANAAKNKSLRGVETFFLSPARSKRSKNVAALENKSDIEEMNYFSKQTFLNVFNREKIIHANKLAIDVQQGMLNRLREKYGGVRDGGVREAPFWVLVGAQMPSILIEVGYITNKTDRVRIFNGHYQNLLAQGVADGIDSYFMKNE